MTEEIETIEIRGGWGNVLYAQFYKEKINKSEKGENDMNNGLFAVSVFDLYMFDTNGKKLLEMKTLTDGAVKISQITDHHCVEVLDSRFNTEFMKAMWGKEDVQKSDYDNMISTDEQVFVVNSKKTLGCKLVLVGKLFNTDSVCEKEYVISIPNAVAVSRFDFETSADGVAAMPIKFDVLPFNDGGDLVEVRVVNK